MLDDAVYSHHELGAEMRKICAAEPSKGDPVSFCTDVEVPYGVDPATVPGYHQTSQGCLPAWRACVAFGNKQRRRSEQLQANGKTGCLVTNAPCTTHPGEDHVALPTTKEEWPPLAYDDKLLGAEDLLALAA